MDNMLYKLFGLIVLVLFLSSMVNSADQYVSETISGPGTPASEGHYGGGYGGGATKINSTITPTPTTTSTPTTITPTPTTTSTPTTITPTPTGCQYNNPSCSAGQQCINNTCVTPAPMTCSDGTQYNACSATKPEYCLSGTLVDKASVCACSSGLVASGDSCIAPTQTPSATTNSTVQGQPQGGFQGSSGW